MPQQGGATIHGFDSSEENLTGMERLFGREGFEWRSVHRHADALVHPITFDRLLELARGQDVPAPSNGQ